MSVEGSALEFAVDRAVANAAKPENTGGEAHQHLKNELDSRSLAEKLEDSISAASRRLAGESLGQSPDAIRVAGDLNVAAVMRHHEGLLLRSQIPTEMAAVLAEVEALDPRRPIMTRSLVSLEIAESSGLWPERPDNLHLIKDDGSRPVFRHNEDRQLINLGGYYFRDDHLRAVRDGETKYHPWADMRTGVINLPLIGGRVWNQAEQKFVLGFPPGAVECVSMPYFKFKELSDELDNPKQRKQSSNASAKPAAIQVTPVATPIQPPVQAPPGAELIKLPSEAKVNEPISKVSVLETAGMSDVGKIREHNEDGYVIWKKGDKEPNMFLPKVDEDLRNSTKPRAVMSYENAKAAYDNSRAKVVAGLELMSQNGVESVVLVADGMGGAAAGEEASQIGLLTVVNEAAKVKWTGMKPDKVEAKLGELVKQANLEIYNSNLDRTDPAHPRKIRDSGSTITGVVTIGEVSYSVNVGDSRVYFFDEDKKALYQMTKDHSLVQALADRGEITRNDVRTHPQRNFILRSLGDKSAVEPDVKELPISGKRGKIIVGSDGFWEMMTEGQMAPLLLQGKDARGLMLDFVGVAKFKGEDNITVAVADVKG